MVRWATVRSCSFRSRRSSIKHAPTMDVTCSGRTPTSLLAQTPTSPTSSNVSSSAMRPAFSDLVEARAVSGPPSLQEQNANLVGGDLTGGALTLRQLLWRQLTARPYRTGIEGVWMCSSWTSAGRRCARDVRLACRSRSPSMTALPMPIVPAEWLAAHLDEVVVADVRWYLDGRWVSGSTSAVTSLTPYSSTSRDRAHGRSRRHAGSSPTTHPATFRRSDECAWHRRRYAGGRVRRHRVA